MSTLIFYSVILLVCAFIADHYKMTPLNLFLAGISGILMMCGVSEDKPTALDVYQGRTTLEITYRDSVPTDSIVIFKNNNK